jgi:hypothetical protein
LQLAHGGVRVGTVVDGVVSQKAYSAVAGARTRGGSNNDAAKKLFEPPRISLRQAAWS